MTGWKQYVYAVILCVLICKVVTQLAADSRQKTLIRLICGVFLCLCILQPLTGLSLTEWVPISRWDLHTADPWIARGEALAREAKAACIKSACETYILDKAELLGAGVSVTVTLDDGLLPVSAEISGNPDTNVQMQLQNILMTDLGIPKENQAWIWNQEHSGSREP